MYGVKKTIVVRKLQYCFGRAREFSLESSRVRTVSITGTTQRVPWTAYQTLITRERDRLGIALLGVILLTKLVKVAYESPCLPILAFYASSHGGLDMELHPSGNPYLFGTWSLNSILSIVSPTVGNSIKGQAKSLLFERVDAKYGSSPPR